MAGLQSLKYTYNESDQTVVEQFLENPYWQYCFVDLGIFNMKRRSAIEAIFGRLKSDNKLERNHLKGKEGNQINAILADCGFNLIKLLRAFFFFIF